MTLFRLSSFSALLGIAFSGAAFAHEGHVHDDEAPPPTVQTAPRATAASPLFELVAVAKGTGLMVYLDRFETNAPVIGATVDVETPAGPASAAQDGEVYRLEAPWVTKPGTYELLFTIAAETEIDFLTATLTIPEPMVESLVMGKPAATVIVGQLRAGIASVPDRLRHADPALIGIGILGLLGGALVMALMRRRLVAVGVLAAVLVLVLGSSVAFAETAPASDATVIRDVAQRLPDGRVFAPKAAQRILAILTMATVVAEHRRSVEMAGRVVPDPNASGFVQTAIGGRLAAPPGGFPSLGAVVKAGDVMALVEPSLAAADQSSIRQSKAELDQEIALEEREVARFQTLAATGTVSQAQLEGAELTLQGLRERRAALDSLRMEPEVLVAPVAGIVSKANAAPGLIADTNTEVFHIIDPAQLWVEALSFGGEPVSGNASIGGEDGVAIPLSLIGAGFAEDGQAQPVHFRIDAAGDLRVGDRVTVFAETASVTTGIAAPREAVIRGTNGEDIVFVHIAPEMFEPRAVRTEPLDGGRVIIVAGIVAGDRVVTQGAELLNQLR
jgi:cobalt-zinc-cadmium efflux system membrane fusion protein